MVIGDAISLGPMGTDIGEPGGATLLPLFQQPVGRCSSSSQEDCAQGLNCFASAHAGFLIGQAPKGVRQSGSQPRPVAGRRVPMLDAWVQTSKGTAQKWRLSVDPSRCYSLWAIGRPSLAAR